MDVSPCQQKNNNTPETIRPQIVHCDDRKTPPQEREENVSTPIKVEMASQTSVRHDTEDPRLGTGCMWRNKKNSRNDGGERGTHTPVQLTPVKVE